MAQIPSSWHADAERVEQLLDAGRFIGRHAQDSGFNLSK